MAVLLLEWVGSSFSPPPPASHCPVKKHVPLRDCREQLTEQSRKFFVLLRNGMIAFLPEGKTKFEQQGAWRVFVSITAGWKANVFSLLHCVREDHRGVQKSASSVLDCSFLNLPTLGGLIFQWEVGSARMKYPFATFLWVTMSCALKEGFL